MTFWAIAYLCMAASGCAGPAPGYDPAASLYASEAACNRLLKIATLPAGLEGHCVQTDTVTISGGRFMPNAALMVARP